MTLTFTFHQIGNEGVSYTMVKTQGINLVLHSSNMKIPLRREELWDAEFKETLVELYNLKVRIFQTRIEKQN
jgi:hypothetical protein